MGCGNNYTTDVSELLHIGNVKEAYRSTNKVDYIQQMLKYNDQCTGLGDMEDTLSHLVLQGWYEFDSPKVTNRLSATAVLQKTR
jgi:hypothetical protein